MNSLVLAARPKTLIASLSPILIGSAMAFAQRSCLFWIFFFTLVTGLGIQISTNLANDLFDFLKGADTNQRKGPTRVTQSGLMSVAQVKLTTMCFMGMTLACGSILIFRGGFVIAALLALALALAVGYTAGPFPLAYLGIAEFFILIFFGPVATASTYYLQTLSLSSKAFLAGLAPGMISCSILIINNLRDIEEDKAVNKKTLVARFGTRFGKWEYAAFLCFASLTPLFFFSQRPLVLLALVTFVPALALINMVFQNNDPYAYNPLLGKTGKLLWLYTFIFSFSFVI